MKRTHKASRPYVRTRRSIRHASLSPAAELASSAGALARPSLEQLESRQLLFSLTITNADPFTGVGQATATFGYVIPYLAPTTTVQTVTDETVTEDFNDEIQPQIPVPFGALLGSPVQFAESNLTLFHTIQANADRRLMPRDPEGQDGWLRLRMQTGQQFSFRASATAGALGPWLGMSSMTMEFFPDGPGFVLDNLRVTMLFDGDVLNTVEGQDISGFWVPPAGGGTAPTTLNGQFTFLTSSGFAFDEIRFEAIAGATNPGFFIDDVSYVVPGNAFDQLMEQRIFGVQVTLSGPVGATAQFLDLYGRDLRQTLRLGKPPDADEILLVDLNFDGIPDFNDGFGSVILNNTDEITSLSIYGGTITLVNGVFTFNLVDSLAGLFDDFESAGFGFEAEDPAPSDGIYTVGGLPPGPGSVILGSPYVRPLTAYNPGGPAVGGGATITISPANADFNRADQGIFVLGGGAMGTVNIHGVVHGSSRFEGAAGTISIGYLVGSISVQGDLGALIVGSDAGLWANELGTAPTTARNKTEGQLVVDRTVGEILVGGRSLMDVTVVGAINTPTASPARDVFRYFEKEYMFAIDPTLPVITVLAASLANTSGHALNTLLSQLATPFFRVSQGIFFGSNFLRNDTLMSAEWVGSIASGVQIHGEIGFADPVNAEDPSDVFAFAVDGTQPIVVEFVSISNLINVRLGTVTGGRSRRWRRMICASADRSISSGS